MVRFRLRGQTVSLETNPSRIAARVTHLARLRDRLIREAGGDIERVDRFLAERFGGVMQHFSGRYVAEMSQRLDRITQLREQLSGIYDSVLRGERPDVQSVQRLLDDLDREMDALQSPTQYLDSLEQVDLPTLEQPTVSPSRHTPDRPSTQPARTVEPTRRRPEEASESRHPRTEAEVIQQRERQALSELLDFNELYDAARRRMEDLRQQEQRYRDRGQSFFAERPQRLRELIEGWLLRRGVGMRAADLMYTVQNSDYLRQLAANGGVPRLRELWVEWHSRPEFRFREDSTFEGYVRRRQSSQDRALVGEFDVAHRLGETHDFLKPPDYDVNQRGTDLVAVDRQTGEILIIDNKAFQSSPDITDVSALVRNFVRNLEDDVQLFKDLYEGDPTIPQHIRDAIPRLESALRDIQSLITPDTDLSDPNVQRQIRDILNQYGIKRKVTNAFGVSQGSDLAQSLQDIGIEFLDVN